jgi:hypothetical protein
VQVDDKTTLVADAVNTTANPNREWVERAITFTTTTNSVTIGLDIPEGKSGTAAIDNLYVDEITLSPATAYPAKNATLFDAKLATTSDGTPYITGMEKAGSAAEFTIDAPEAGEYFLAIHYANGGDSASQLKLLVNGESLTAVTFPQTAAYGQFSQNIVHIPMLLRQGKATIRLEKGEGDDKTELRNLVLHP